MLHCNPFKSPIYHQVSAELLEKARTYYTHFEASLTNLPKELAQEADAFFRVSQSVSELQTCPPSIMHLYSDKLIIDAEAIEQWGYQKHPSGNWYENSPHSWIGTSSDKLYINRNRTIKQIEDFVNAGFSDAEINQYLFSSTFHEEMHLLQSREAAINKFSFKDTIQQEAASQVFNTFSSDTIALELLASCPKLKAEAEEYYRYFIGHCLLELHATILITPLTLYTLYQRS